VVHARVALDQILPSLVRRSMPLMRVG